MRIAVLLTALALVPGATRGLLAQEHRIQVTPLAAFTSPDAIYDKTTVYPGDPVGVMERLSVDAATAFGGRISYRVTPRWTVGVEASRASSSYSYRYDSGALQEEGHGSSSISTLLTSASRELVRTAAGTRVEGVLLGGVHRLAVDKDPVCGPPSLGGPPCYSSPERWQDNYSVPFGGVGLGASQRVSPRLSVDARGTYSVGRANTQAFWQDLLPQYDAYEADRHHWLHTVSLSLGLAVGL